MVASRKAGPPAPERTRARDTQDAKRVQHSSSRAMTRTVRKAGATRFLVRCVSCISRFSRAPFGHYVVHHLGSMSCTMCTNWIAIPTLLVSFSNAVLLFFYRQHITITISRTCSTRSTRTALQSVTISYSVPCWTYLSAPKPRPRRLPIGCQKKKVCGYTLVWLTSFCVHFS
jgi:hypothetical protein